MDNNEILLKLLKKENELLKKHVDDEKDKKSELQREYKILEDMHNELENRFNLEVEKNNKILEEKANIEEQLNSILYSRSYKIIKKIKKILGR